MGLGPASTSVEDTGKITLVGHNLAVVAGIDVGTVNLDASVSEGTVIRFDNTAAGLTKLLKHLRALDVTTAVCESTGGYERLLVNRLRQTEIAVYVAHRNRVRACARARARGYEAKTDPQDAQVLSRYGQVFPDAVLAPMEK